MNQNARKNRMRLLSGFYELASRFTEKELVEIRDDVGGDKISKDISSLVLALNAADEPVIYQRVTAQKLAISHSRESVSTPRRREAALREILSSKELFSSPRDIAISVPGSPDLRGKESREKYINRILVKFRTLSSSEQLDFISAVQKRMEDKGLEIKGSSNFVSRWSRLIREL